MKRSGRKFIISGAIILTILVASYALATYIIENKIENYVTSYLEKIIDKEGKGIYFAETGKVKVKLLKREILVEDILLKERESGTKIINITSAGISKLSPKFSNGKLSIDTSKIHFSLLKSNLVLPGNLYTLEIESIDFKIMEKNLKIHDISFSSIVPKWEFAQKDPKHSDWFDLQINSIEMKGIELDSLLSDKKLYADSLFVDKINLQNYKNAQIPIKHNYMPMIYTVVQRLPIPFHISFVRATHMNVEYEELPKKGNKPGRINVSDLNGTFYNYTNIITSPKQTSLLEANGKLMGEGKFTAKVVLPVDSTYDHISLDIHLGAMSMISLNPILENMTPVRAENGFIREGNFHIQGNSKRAFIQMKLLYNDLTVDILAQNGDKKTDIPFFSFLANGVISRNNPDNGEEVRIITSHYERDPLHSSFNYLWKTMYSALIEVIGYTESRQEAVEWVREKLHL
ncbi:hypothetical protein LJB98_03160 [Bacteroidales bacterium OttesenSCG-928-M11]|nr:hypothetical protein [Bacteroidales bacterium OttesenSCG-928-M11]